MVRSTGVALLLAIGSVVLPLAVVNAVSNRSVPSGADEGGICADAGCVTGPDKCTSGTITTPSGGSATYTCYTRTVES